MTFRVKVVEDPSFNERLSQFNKSLSSSWCEKAQLRLFELRQIFRLWRFLNFCPNLIINLIAINLIVVNPSPIQLVSAMSSSATTNPDSALTGSCLRLSTPWSFQHWGKWYSYLTEFLDKSSIKIRKSEEHLDVSYSLRVRPLLDSLDFFILHADAFWQYHIAKEPNFLLMKPTLLQDGK